MAHAWDDANYQKRREVAIDATNIDGNLTDFPLLIKLEDAEQVANADMISKRYVVYDHNGTLLKFEEEIYTEGASYVNFETWIKVPTLYASPTGDQNKVWVYYDYDPGSDQDDAANVWDANFKGVYHLGESGDGTADEYVDSSGSGHHGQGGGGDSGKCPDQVSGQIGNCQDFVNPANDDYIGVADHADHDPGGAMTIEAWCYAEDGAADAIAVHDMSSYKWLLYCTAGETYTFYAKVGGTTYNTGVSAGFTDTWKHVAGTFDRTLGSSRLKLYIDGVEDQTDNAADADITAGDEGIFIGSKYNGLLDGLDGKIDELRYSAVARPAAWLKFGFHNVDAADNEQTWGAEETVPSVTAKPLYVIGGGILA